MIFARRMVKAIFEKIDENETCIRNTFEFHGY